MQKQLELIKGCKDKREFEKVLRNTPNLLLITLRVAIEKKFKELYKEK